MTSHVLRRSAAVLAALAATLLLVTALPATAGAAAKPKAPSAGSALTTLVKQTTALPRNAITPVRRATLLRAARKAKSAVLKSPCVSVTQLSAFRRALARTKLSPRIKGTRSRASANKKLAQLGASSATATRRLLLSSKTKRCGGGKTAASVSKPTTRVLHGDTNGMTIHVDLPELQFVPETGGGQKWTKLALKGTDAPGAPGTPGIPTTSDVLAISQGATYSVSAKVTSSYTVDGVNVYPVQDDVVDQAKPPFGLAPKPDFTDGPFVDKKFDFTPAAYDKAGPVPAAPASGKELGQARDLTIAGLNVPAAQYDPKTDKLKVLQGVDIELKFTGGATTFSPTLTSPWETAQLRTAGGLLNVRAILADRLKQPPIVYQPCGEELLVITNPATLSAANTFATARRAAGFLTRVVQTGAGSGFIGTTAAQIQTYIRSQLNHPFCIRPSYVTFIGDDELVPTFTDGPGGIPSDLKYSMKNDTDELPDVATGRIVGNDLTQVNNAIAKIIHYETSPPTGPMLNKAAIAAMFQDTDAPGEVNDGQEDRTFVQFAETVRTGLVARGVAVDRIYEDNPTTTPTKFNDGTALPASLQKPTFAWDGDGADVSAAWNQGRFLVIHRDHGWSDGWGDPYFTTTEVDALTNTNDNLPVVMSINCASAQYDTDESSFVQNALVKATGGAVGVFGDTRNSPSWHNSQIGLGFVDALLPSVLPAEGPATKQRMGDALVHGKLRLAGVAPPSGPGIAGGDGNTRNELYLWHFFGDPTMQMWGGGSPPIALDPSRFKAIYKTLVKGPGDPNPYAVLITLPKELVGQPVSLLRNGEVIGKALAGDGSVTVDALFTGDAPKPGELSVALEPDGSPPVKVGVDDVPNPAPATPKATTLTQTCPTGLTLTQVGNVYTGTLTVTGKLTTAPAGSTVTVSFMGPTHTGTGPQPPPTVITKTVTTDASGNWTASADVSEAGNWTASSSYAGTSDYVASAGGTCTVPVSYPAG
jgi:hypothetical protein